MPKTISVGLDSHLQGIVTTLARCWKITRRDQTEFFFTDHDVAIEFPVGSGDIYIAWGGFNSTAVANNASLNVDNLTASGFFDDATITDEDIKAGLFDYAEVRLFVVNWADLSQNELKMRRGWLGEIVTSPSGMFKTELRGMTQVLAQTIIELFGPECRADLGDSRCKIPIDPAVRLNATVYEEGDFIKVATAAGTDYSVYENVIYVALNDGTTAGSPPAFDTTPGNTTQDGGVAATGTLTLTGNAANTNTVTTGDKVYTFQTVLTDVDGNVLIGATASDSIDNLIAAINLGAGSGTVYAASTTANGYVSAAAGAGDTMDVTALVSGDAGNDIATTDNNANMAWGGASLSGGISGVLWEAVTAWSRDFEVATVTDRLEFTITVTEPRAVDGWFDGGVVVFDGTSDNAGRAFEIKTWDQSSGQVVLFLPVGFDIQVGDTGHIYPGCDKRMVTCRDKFNNILNRRAEDYLPGRDGALETPNAH
jgi:uncharacterized phage protein (TIGR02218 family)